MVKISLWEHTEIDNRRILMSYITARIYTPYTVYKRLLFFVIDGEEISLWEHTEIDNHRILMSYITARIYTLYIYKRLSFFVIDGEEISLWEHTVVGRDSVHPFGFLKIHKVFGRNLRVFGKKTEICVCLFPEIDNRSIFMSHITARIYTL